MQSEARRLWQVWGRKGGCLPLRLMHLMGTIGGGHTALGSLIVLRVCITFMFIFIFQHIRRCATKVCGVNFRPCARTSLQPYDTHMYQVCFF